MNSELFANEVTAEKTSGLQDSALPSAPPVPFGKSALGFC